MKLPKMGIRSAPEAQKQRLARWLAEWEMDADLRATEREETASSAERQYSGVLPVSPLSDEAPPGAGQIRLLSPGIRSGMDRWLYLALIEDAAEESLLAVPFGRFAEPCVPGELSTGREAIPLRVLCLWNAILLPGGVLKESWVVDRLSSKEMGEADTVWRNVRRGEVVPEPLQRRVGPSCWYSADPRQAYMAEEARFMKKLLNGWPGNKRLGYPIRDSSLRKAAEPRTSYGTKTDASDKPHETDSSGGADGHHQGFHP